MHRTAVCNPARVGASLMIQRIGQAQKQAASHLIIGSSPCLDGIQRGLPHCQHRGKRTQAIAFPCSPYAKEAGYLYLDPLYSVHVGLACRAGNPKPISALLWAWGLQYDYWKYMITRTFFGGFERIL